MFLREHTGSACRWIYLSRPDAPCCRYKSSTPGWPFRSLHGKWRIWQKRWRRQPWEVASG